MRRVHRWIYIVVGAYTFFTILLWRAENGGHIYAPIEPTDHGKSLQEIETKPAIQKVTIVTSKSPKTQTQGSRGDKCPGLDPPTNVLRDSWQSANGNRVYVYSAYFEPSRNHVVVIGARDKLSGPALWCQLWGEDGRLQVTRTAHRDMPEGKGKRYTCAFYTCPVPAGLHPTAVSLMTSECGKPTSSVFVHGAEGDNGNFTVCVTPLNFNYSKAYELVEMIELNKILGASHFVFYSYSINKNVQKVLEYYKDKGVEVVPWNLPMNVDTWPKKNIQVEIHYFGQLGALNDCLYRNRYKSPYVVFQDLDEFIIPRKVSNWNEMFQTLPKNKGSYMFRNTFFRKDWPDTDQNFTEKLDAQKYKMITILKQSRESKIFPRKHRSKYIVVPKNIDALGIHSVNRFRAGGEQFVEPDVALMHHYRDWENPTDKQPRSNDNRIMAYKEKLVNNVKNAWEKLKGVPLGPLPFS